MFLVPKEYGQPKNLGELVGIVQTWKRGCNFFELAFQSSGEGIEIVIDSYNPTCAKDDRAIPNASHSGLMIFWDFKSKKSYRFEHFLQDIRSHFPGINFCDIIFKETSYENDAVLCGPVQK